MLRQRVFVPCTSLSAIPDFYVCCFFVVTNAAHVALKKIGPDPLLFAMKIQHLGWLYVNVRNNLLRYTLICIAK
jgi:hypothetical protein